MQERVIRHVPVVDDEGRVLELITLEELVPKDRLPLQAVIMAGGFGKRLHPLTENLPKPMLPVGDKPLMELIINQLRDSGIDNTFAEWTNLIGRRHSQSRRHDCRRPIHHAGGSCDWRNAACNSAADSAKQSRFCGASRRHSPNYRRHYSAVPISGSDDAHRRILSMGAVIFGRV